jgi:hypothetical protein
MNDETGGAALRQGRAGAIARLLVLGLGFVVGAAGWLFASEVVSVATPDGPQYLVATQSLTVLILSCLGACGLLFAAYRVCPSLSPFAPIALLALPLLALALLATPLRAFAPPWLYVFVDLRWWLATAVALLVVIELFAESGRAWPLQPTGLHVWESGLLLALVAGTIVASPKGRFEASIVGDEPKYIRFLENWYRGKGVDVSNLGPIDELPANYQPDVLGNVGLAVAALSWTARDLVADARRQIGLSDEPRPRGAYSKGGNFVEGKRGGVYQVHTPGFPLLLFGSYCLDRDILNWTSPPHSQFPTFLHATNLTLLGLYLFWGLALFRLVDAHTRARGISWLVACVAMASLPAAAFAYQYYPEAAGGLFIAVLARYSVMSDDTRLGRAFWYGVMAGYLPWLHVRFGAAAMLATAAVVLSRGRVRWQAAAAFVLGVALPVAALCLYSYHITGSLMPSEVWTLLIDEPVFKTSIALRRFAGLWFDIDWGLIAHAPVYLLAFGGLVPMWRQDRRLAIWVTLCLLTLWIPAAGHNWHGSGTTPLRIVTSTVPLLALPLGAALQHFRRSRWFVTLFTFLGVVSIHNSLQFNANFARDWPVLHGPTFSGWSTRLAMPFADAGDPLRNPHVLVWFAIAAAGVVWPLVRSPGPRSVVRPWTTVVATVLLTVAATATAIAAWTGVSTRSRFMLEPPAVRDRYAAFHLAHPTGVLWSSRAGTTTLSDIFPNPVGVDLKIEAGMPSTVVGAEVPLTMVAVAPDGAAGWGEVVVDFGDGRPAMNMWMVGKAGTHHAYAKPGDYRITATASFGRGEGVSRSTQVRVLESELIAPYDTAWISGLPAEVLGRPVALRIDRATIGDSRLEVTVSAMSSGTDFSSADFWVWLIGYESQALRARLISTVRNAGRGNAVFSRGRSASLF